MRYFLAFSYFGKAYCGYQIQPNAVTVQETLEKALCTLLRTPIKTTAAGRTDTGVHAKKMYAHFDVDAAVPENLVYLLNRFLPNDIAVHEVFLVSDTAHARFDATYRTYEYYISLDKNAFSTDTSWQHWNRKLSIEKMNLACTFLFDYTDFTSFSKLHTDNKTNLCTLYKAEWEQRGNELKFTISANRFLRNMVRAIVGTLVEVGAGKIAPEELKKIIEQKNRQSAGTSAPAHGLYLVDVGYPFIP